MNKIFRQIVVLAVAGTALVAMSANAQADSSDIEYHGGKKAYDKRIEQAAIKRAAGKIGELRGSIKDNDSVHILTAEDLLNKSSGLGFPIVSEPEADRALTTGAVRIM